MVALVPLPALRATLPGEGTFELCDFVFLRISKIWCLVSSKRVSGVFGFCKVPSLKCTYNSNTTIPTITAPDPLLAEGAGGG
jgi:hypothetical protein